MCIAVGPLDQLLSQSKLLFYSFKYIDSNMHITETQLKHNCYCINQSYWSHNIIIATDKTTEDFFFEAILVLVHAYWIFSKLKIITGFFTHL